MTPRDHCDDSAATVSPQALVWDLRAQEGALPETLRRQFVAAGAAVVPALIALLEDALTDDQAEPEGASYHAVELLGALAALRTLGPAAFEGCLAAYVMTTNEAFRDRLAGVMSRCGVHDERLYARLVETLQRTPELGANYLAEYGEARALDVLAHTFDTLPLRDEETPLANHVFIELRAAIEDLGAT
jgi:hypothetical protein